MRCCGLDLPEDRFPTARWESSGHRKRSWRGLYDQWRTLPAYPLQVSATLANGYVSTIDGGLHLDGILSAACLSLFASRVEDCVAPSIIPLPLALSWVSPQGLPLWTATDLMPVDEVGKGVCYVHSRYPTHRADLASRQSAVMTAGRYKDARIPLQVTGAAAVEGFCIGDPAAVVKLLDRITHIGRKGAHGHGRVLRWEVEPCAVTEDDVMDLRPVPIEYLAETGEGVVASRLFPRRGWTPPYWYAPAHAPVRTSAWRT